MNPKINTPKPTNNQEQVVAYMRYSSNNQDEQSIAYQRNAIMTYAISKHYFVISEYIDEARTGTNDKRKGFQELLSDAHSHPKWNKILVYDMSRFTRNNRDAIKYTAELEDLGIEIMSVTQAFDNSNEGFLSKGIVNLLNEYYSRNLSKHTHAGLKQKANEARHCGGIAPLGYDIDTEGHLVINPTEAECVKLIFDLFEANYSYAKIAKELNKRGHRTKTGNQFHKNSFSSILHQEKYIGTYIWNRTRKKNNQGKRNSHQHKPTGEQVVKYNAIPAIIEPEQFQRVQQLLKSRRNGCAESKSRHYYLLSGIHKLKCAECGASLIGTTRKSHGIVYKYYYCPNHKRHTCSLKEIRADRIDRFIVNAVVTDISKRKDLITLFNESDKNGRLKALNKKLTGLEKASRNILMSLRYTASKELVQELTRISDEKNAIKAELEGILQSQYTLTESDRPKLCKQIAKMIMTSECFEVKKYLSAIIDQIIVSNDTVELSLNIA